MHPVQRFIDRSEAGRALAHELEQYRGQADLLVLALPRGGVPVAHEIAEHLNAPLDIFLVRKLGVPGHEELAMGAIASGGTRVMNQEVLDMIPISSDAIERVAAQEGAELERRQREYRGDRREPEIHDRVIILVDDGLATGATMKAAIKAVQLQEPRRLIVAVPVAAAETCEELRAEVDEVVCLFTPDPFRAVGLWYQNFDQTTDEEVVELLNRETVTHRTR